MTSRTWREERPKIQCPGEAAGMKRGGARVVEHDEVGGRADLESPEAGLAEGGSDETPAFREALERPVGARALVVLAEAEVRRPRLLEHVRPDAVGAERDPRPEHVEPGPPDRVVHVRARVVGDRRVRRVDERDLVVVEVDAVREQRAVVEGSRVREPGGDTCPMEHDRVALVDGVLGRVDVQTDLEVPRGEGARGERVVGERERGVRSDQGTRQRQLVRANALREATVLHEACLRALGARHGLRSRSRGPSGRRGSKEPSR